MPVRLVFFQNSDKSHPGGLVSLVGSGSNWYICRMQHLLENIASLYQQWKGKEASSIELLPQSGSERRYFRIQGENESLIGDSKIASNV